MKVFISADIEGITTTTVWDDCNPQHPNYVKHAEQMTKEVLAACEGAIAAGADEIVVKDAHGPAINIDVTQMPACVSVRRGWTGHPYSMAYGVDKTFDAAMFVGYHSAAGRGGNPLSHTMTGSTTAIKLNGRYVSEFMLYSLTCAMEGVPTVFLAGDKMLCEDYKDLHPKLVTVAVKEGLGAMTLNHSPKKTLVQIKEGAEKALTQDFKGALPTLPEHFVLEVYYKEHPMAHKMSYYPGAKQGGDNWIVLETDNYMDVLTALRFIL